MSEPLESFETIRPLLVEAAIVDGPQGQRARVALEYNTALYVGERVLSEGDEEPALAAAGATTAALDTFTPDAIRFTLEWCERLDPGQGLPEVVATMVGVDVAGTPMRYAGAAIVAQDGVAVAGAKATLAALNRRLGIAGL